MAATTTALASTGTPGRLRRLNPMLRDLNPLIVPGTTGNIFTTALDVSGQSTTARSCGREAFIAIFHDCFGSCLPEGKQADHGGNSI